MIKATAVVRHRATGSTTLLYGRGDSRLQARRQALGLIREGETLVEVAYEEISDPVPLVEVLAEETRSDA